jgi:hypothetical protein
MTTRRLRSLAALLASAALAGATVPPADADAGQRDYRRGNAPAAIDITQLTVGNAEKAFEIVVDVRDLRQQGSFHFHYWGGRHATPPARSVLMVVHRREGVTRARFLTCDRQECVRATCRSFDAVWLARADRVAVAARQGCFPGDGAPEAGRFFAWSRTTRHVDPGSNPLLVKRG